MFSHLICFRVATCSYAVSNIVGEIRNLFTNSNKMKLLIESTNSKNVGSYNIVKSNGPVDKHENDEKQGKTPFKKAEDNLRSSFFPSSPFSTD